jgi:hypothetical protein
MTRTKPKFRSTKRSSGPRDSSGPANPTRRQGARVSCSTIAERNCLKKLKKLGAELPNWRVELAGVNGQVGDAKKSGVVLALRSARILNVAQDASTVA